MTEPTTVSQQRTPVVPGLWAIVGFLLCVELASGVLQGYYTPIFTDIADHLASATPTSTGSRPHS